MAERPVAPRATPPQRTGAPAEDRARRQQAQGVNALLDGPLARVRRVGEFTIGTGLQKAIPHGLGSTLGDWFITSQRTFGRVREVSRDAETLTLEADLGQTFTLWVMPA